MTGRNVSFALIIVLIFAVALSGCSGPSSSVTATPDANDSAKLAAHDAYVEKQNATVQYHDELGQLDIRMQNTNYSDAGALMAVTNMTGEIDGYISSLTQAGAAADNYRAYLSSDSDEYKQLVNYDINLNASISSAQDVRNRLYDYRDMLSLYASWQQAGDSLHVKFDSYAQPRYGEDMRQWLLELQPQVTDFISGGDRARSSIDTAIYETPESPAKASMGLMKQEIGDRSDSYKERYNALATQYNATFGQAFGSVPVIQ